MRYMMLAAALAVLGGQAAGQPNPICQDASPAACAGDRACVAESRRLRQQCVNANANGLGARPTVAVPEPATAILLGSGLLGLALTLRKKNRKSAEKDSAEKDRKSA